MATRVTGQAQVRAVAKRLYASPGVLSVEQRKALERAAPQIPPLIDAAAALRMPKRGGFLAMLTLSMRFDANIHKTGMDMRFWAQGKKDHRDVRSFNNGIIRHPLFGNRKVWKVTLVRPGFISDPVRHDVPPIIKRELAKGVNETSDFIRGR